MRTNAWCFLRRRRARELSVAAIVLLVSAGSIRGNVVDDGTYVYLSGVPYIHQVYDTADSFGAGHYACSTTAALMAIVYYNVLPANPMTVSRGGTHVSQYGYYVSSPYTFNGRTYNIPSSIEWGAEAAGYYGGFGYMLQDHPGSDPGRAARLSEYIALHGLRSAHDELSAPTENYFQTILGEINANRPVMVYTTFTASNHYALCIGYVKGQHTLIFNDPYGNRNQADYPNYNGAGVFYDWPGYNHGHVSLVDVRRLIYSGPNCSYSISSANANHGSGYVEGSFGVISPNGCTWTASSGADWIHTSSSGTGDGTVNYTVDRNEASGARQGIITVQGQTFTVHQASSIGTPGTVTLLSPAQGGVVGKSDLPGLSWQEGDPPADWYHVYINRDGSHYYDFWIQANRSSGQTTWASSQAFLVGNYTWWVRSWNSAGYGAWSQAGMFTVSGGPTQITAISPDGTTESSSTVTYAWNVPDTATAWYEVYVMKDGAFFSDTWHRVADGDLVQTGNGGLGQVALAKGGHSTGNYSWWVRGWSADGLGRWSSTMSFSVALQAAGTVTLISPAPGEIVSDPLPQFSWQSDSGAPWFWLWLYRNGSVYHSQWVQGNSWVPANNLPVGNYTWWLGPWNTGGLGTWASSSFTVQGRVPGKITMLGPSGTVSAQSAMAYTWTADANATWYELAIVKNGTVWFDRWIGSSTSGGAGEFQAQVNQAHGSGNYNWWVRGWSSDGMGAWSDAMAFSIP